MPIAFWLNAYHIINLVRVALLLFPITIFFEQILLTNVEFICFAIPKKICLLTVENFRYRKYVFLNLAF